MSDLWFGGADPNVDRQARTTLQILRDQIQRLQVTTRQMQSEIAEDLGVIVEDLQELQGQITVTTHPGSFKVAAGVSDAFFNGVYFSNVTTVTHNLGALDSIIVLTPRWTVNTNHITAWAYFNVQANSFDVEGSTVNGTAIGPGSIEFSWMMLYRDS